MQTADVDTLVARLERATAAIEALTAQAALVTPALAVVTDSADEFVARADARGVQVDARLHDAVHLLERLTAPDTMHALNTLMDRLPQLEQLLALVDQAPGFVAMGVDSLDDVVRELQGRGVNNVVSLIGTMGASLAKAADAAPKPVGLGGALRALRDPNVKQALGLLLTFAAEFGRQLDTTAHGTRGRARS